MSRFKIDGAIIFVCANCGTSMLTMVKDSCSACGSIQVHKYYKADVATAVAQDLAVRGGESDGTMIKPKFTIGQKVFLSTDPDQLGRICTGYIVRRSEILYYLSHIGNETVHYDYEITAQVDQQVKLGIDKD